MKLESEEEDILMCLFELTYQRAFRVASFSEIVEGLVKTSGFIREVNLSYHLGKLEGRELIERDCDSTNLVRDFPIKWTVTEKGKKIVALFQGYDAKLAEEKRE